MSELIADLTKGKAKHGLFIYAHAFRGLEQQAQTFFDVDARWHFVTIIFDPVGHGGWRAWLEWER